MNRGQWFTFESSDHYGSIHLRSFKTSQFGSSQFRQAHNGSLWIITRIVIGAKSFLPDTPPFPCRLRTEPPRSPSLRHMGRTSSGTCFRHAQETTSTTDQTRQVLNFMYHTGLVHETPVDMSCMLIVGTLGPGGRGVDRRLRNHLARETRDTGGRLGGSRRPTQPRCSTAAKSTSRGELGEAPED